MAYLETMKPCPFCGSTSTLCIIKENGEYVVCCDYSQGGCGATAGYRESIKEAKTIWNTRTNCPKCGARMDGDSE